jgi:hypothetical protein
MAGFLCNLQQLLRLSFFLDLLLQLVQPALLLSFGLLALPDFLLLRAKEM